MSWGVDGVSEEAERPAAPVYSFQEYELYYQTTERVIDRRLALNNWNYGICATIMAAIGLITQWAVENTGFMLVVFVMDVILGVMGALLCTLWVSQLRDYKALNDAKFEILNRIAPHVRFEGGEDITSFEPFRHEWDLMKASYKRTTFKAINRLTLSSSTSELMIPMAFRWIFIVTVAVSAAILVVNWESLGLEMFRLQPHGAAG